MQLHSTKAIPQSKASIRQKVRSFKETFKIPILGKIDVIKYLEYLQYVEFLEIEVVPDLALKNSYAETDLLNRKVYIRESVYIRAAKGNPRDRFTIAHELGHVVLHTGRIVVCRANEEIKAYENPEWQANQFAAEFLAPLEAIKVNDSINEISNMFQISKEVASYRKKEATSC
ncbi:ImmA/IrrE family metallo-endopeptidase [Fusobacterium necrophorum subsp. funduliforme]|uniref:ImmA/IrrE family metallo-endopeptidase n=1 Tax=Fusobacterium necrophorum TaxID=859 RepID=UPI00370EA5A9